MPPTDHNPPRSAQTAAAGRFAHAITNCRHAHQALDDSTTTMEQLVAAQRGRSTFTDGTEVENIGTSSAEPQHTPLRNHQPRLPIPRGPFSGHIGSHALATRCATSTTLSSIGPGINSWGDYLESHPDQIGADSDWRICSRIGLVLV